jgi:hypothetical protein
MAVLSFIFCFTQRSLQDATVSLLVPNLSEVVTEKLFCIIFGPKRDEGTGVWWKMHTEEIRSIILPVVLYGCETWSLTLREEHRLRV